MKTLKEYVLMLTEPRRVLFVEDDLLMADVLQKVGHSFNCHMTFIRYAASAQEMLMFAKFDLVFLDVRLEDGSGVEVFRFMRANGIMTPVCFLTGYLDDRTINEVRKIGFAAMMAKPTDCSPDTLKNLFVTFGIRKKDIEPIPTNCCKPPGSSNEPFPQI